MADLTPEPLPADVMRDLGHTGAHLPDLAFTLHAADRITTEQAEAIDKAAGVLLEVYFADWRTLIQRASG